MNTRACMVDSALEQLLLGTLTGRARVIDPRRASTRELGVMEMRGLRSFPDENNAAKEPAWNTLSATDEITKVTSVTEFAGMLRVARTVALSLLWAVRDTDTSPTME